MLISADAIAARVSELGPEIARAIPAGNLTVVGILRGAFVFMADLVRAIPRDLRCDFVAVRSYGDALVSSGHVEMTADLLAPIEGRHLLLVEDIVDTGLTLRRVVDMLSTRGPASVHVCALLVKPAGLRQAVPVAFTGFHVPDEGFLVGYGLDASQRWRNLPYIAAIAGA